MLDGAPPSPPEKIYSKPSPPGADTEALLGSPDASDPTGRNAALAEPGNKLLMAVAMFMEASNLADSVSPQFVPPPVKQWIAMAMEQAPMIAEQMATQSNPLAMLSAAGQSAAPNPMGMSAMGQPPAPAAAPPMAGGRIPSRGMM